MFLTEEDKDSFLNKGYTIIDDFLPTKLCNELYNSFQENNDFKKITQERTNHYKTILKTDKPNFPSQEEIYLSSFNKSESLVVNKYIKEFNTHIKKYMLELSDVEIKYYTNPLCYKLSKGDFLRMHRDLYAGEVGYTLYLTKNWVWDWGGILNVYLENDNVIPILPKYNRIIFRNEKTKLNHFVSEITSFAKNDRFSINGWASVKNLSDTLGNKTIGGYNE